MVGRHQHVFPLALVAAVTTITGHDVVNQPLQENDQLMCQQVSEDQEN